MIAKLFILKGSIEQIVSKDDSTGQRNAQRPRAVYPCRQLQTCYIRVQIALDQSETRLYLASDPISQEVTWSSSIC
jgi:hypothetical protein